MSSTETLALEGRLDALESKLDAILAGLQAQRERDRRVEEAIELGVPIARQASVALGEQLQALEEQGYVALARSMKGGMDRVLQAFTPEDFELLAQNLVGILEVVRNLTQPEVLAIADEAALALREAGSSKPVSVMAALKASREEEVQRGMAVALQVLRQVGRAAQAQRGRGAARPRRGPPAGLDPRLAARLSPSRKPVEAPAPAVAPPPSKGEAPVAGEGGEWSRELARAIAAAEGVELNEQAWAIVEYARAAFQSTGSSPNIRAITKGMGIDTKDIYACFPKAPGRTIARIGGIPKPAGCI